jgi:hypothetical protein
MNLVHRFAAASLALLLLSACDKGRVFIDVTDAPVDESTIKAAQIQFDGIELLRADGTKETFAFDPPKQIEMLDLQNAKIVKLLDNEQITAGDFSAVNLQISAAAGNTVSFVTKEGVVDPIPMVLTDITKLKITQAFTLDKRKEIHLVIDFNMRRSLLPPATDETSFKLDPVLRLVDKENAGEVAGSVAASMVPDGACAAPVVYVYAGNGQTPGDAGGTTPPITSAKVLSDGTNFKYRVTFLPEGDYTIAFTCDALNDDPSKADTLVFSGTRDVHVDAGHTTAADL